MIETSRLFDLGVVVATPAAIDLLKAAGVSPLELIYQHSHGDFGVVCVEDAQSNIDAIRDGARILSAYVIDDERLFIITESDRSSTCILLANEY